MEQKNTVTAKPDDQVTAVRMIATVAGGRTKISVRFVPAVITADALIRSAANSNERAASLMALASAFGKSMAHLKGEGQNG